jgi:hypothetical protein
MRQTLFAIVTASLIAVAFAATPAERAAQTAAESWLALIDGGKVQESFQGLAEPARNGIGELKWKLGFNSIQRKFGPLTGRTLRTAHSATKSPGGRPGEFVLFEFQSTSTKHGTVTEKVATSHEADGEWRVISYTVE